MGYTPHILVIGGGVLGTAIARDLALRGLEVTVVEQGTLTAGTSGRMQGLLYSGARFAGSNPTGAKRCRRESYILRRIADHYVTDTGGIIAPAAEQGAAFEDHVAAIDACEITHDKLGGDELSEYGFDDSVDRAVRVPDAAIHPFRLTLATAAGAANFGAEIKTGARVVEVHREDDRITGVTVEYRGSDAAVPAPTGSVAPEAQGVTNAEREQVTGTTASEESDEGPAAEDAEDHDEASPDGDQEEREADGREESAEDEEEEAEMPGEIQRSFPGVEEESHPGAGETEEIEADYVVNATGAWADRIAALAGIDLPLSRTRGTMLVVDGEPDAVHTRFDPDEQPLSLSPFWDNGILGPIPEEAGATTADLIDATLDEAETFVPALKEQAVLRSYSGVWTQHGSSSGDPYGPGATLVDHEKYDDCWGMLTVIGGTVTTHRFVAERAVDRVCAEFGIDRDCLTADIELPAIDVERSEEQAGSDAADRANATANTVQSDFAGGPVKPNPVLCETKSVRRRTVTAIFDDDEVQETNLEEVRIRTGATMGACQGGRCAHRIAALLHPKQELETVDESLHDLLANRWRGRRPTLWGEQLASALDDYEFHAHTLNRGVQPEQEAIDLEQFDDGREPPTRDPPTTCEAMKR